MILKSEIEKKRRFTNEAYLMQVTELKDHFGDAAQPGLAVVLVGDRKDSET